MYMYTCKISHTVHRYMYMNKKQCVTPEKKCATLYSCFWLVGRHQQGVAQTISGHAYMYIWLTLPSNVMCSVLCDRLHSLFVRPSSPGLWHLLPDVRQTHTHTHTHTHTMYDIRGVTLLYVYMTSYISLHAQWTHKYYILHVYTCTCTDILCSIPIHVQCTYMYIHVHV